MKRITGILVALGFTAYFILAGAIDAHAATECVTFDLSYEVRPGPAQALIGVTVDLESWDLPDHWAGLPGTLHVETANGPSVHWNNFGTFQTNGFVTNVTGTEDTANGVRIGDTTITAIGGTLDFAYTIGTRDARDVPGVEGASLEGTVTICATVPDVTTTTVATTTTSTTTVPSTSTTLPTTSTTGPTTTISTPTSTTVPATSTTAPTGSTTTTGPTPPPTVPPSTTTTFPETSSPTLPWTGPAGLVGLGVAGLALLTLGFGLKMAGGEER